ncbi:MAG TPA: DUF4142 domain-containing protein [Opitutaceae bacterium]|nr:DUF4142 domain-containing protein [Opitutaceae bacterium]
MKSKLKPTRRSYKLNSLCTLLLGLACTGLPAVGRAQMSEPTPSPSPSRGSSDQLAHGDRRFVEKAAMSGMKEVSLSQLAAERATNPEVKSFANRMVTDHQQANTELQALAAKKNVDIKKPEEKGREDDYKSLSKKTGKDFDEAYVKQMVKDHDEAVELFGKAAKDGKDPEVVAFANKYLPTLNDHLQHIKSLSKSVQ